MNKNIDKRIKELQQDTRFTFKLTDDVIDMVYRIACDDLNCNSKVSKIDDNEINQLKNDLSVAKDKIKKLEDQLDKTNKSTKFGSKEGQTKKQDIEKIKFDIQKKTYKHILDYISKHSDLMEVYIYIKEKAKLSYDERFSDRDWLY